MPTPRKTNISPENQWLEGVFPIEIYSPFLGDMLVFRGAIETTSCTSPSAFGSTEYHRIPGGCHDGSLDHDNQLGFACSMPGKDLEKYIRNIIPNGGLIVIYHGTIRKNHRQQIQENHLLQIQGRVSSTTR